MFSTFSIHIYLVVFIYDLGSFLLVLPLPPDQLNRRRNIVATNWRRYALEANNKVYFCCYISFVHNSICHAITALSGNISTRVTYKKPGPWLTLANHLMCHLMIKVSWSWANAPMNIGHVGHDGHTPKALLMQLDQSQSSTLHITKKQSNQFLRPWGHYCRRMLWLHQPSSHNWVTEKVSLVYAKGVGRDVWTKSGICPSTWRIDTLGPLGDNCIYELASMWLGHGVCNVMR
jgi:hypothetical protein